MEITEKQKALLIKNNMYKDGMTKEDAHTVISNLFGSNEQKEKPKTFEDVKSTNNTQSSEKYKLTEGNIRSNALSSAIAWMGDNDIIMENFWIKVKEFEDYIRNGISKKLE